MPDSFAKYHQTYWFSCTYLKPCPSNNLDNETEIVLHMLYVYFITVHQNTILYTVMWNMWQEEKKQRNNHLSIWQCSKNQNQNVEYVKSVVCWQSSVLCELYEEKINNLWIIHDSMWTLWHFLLSITFNSIDVREQTQRKQSSKPKPQSEFSAETWGVFRTLRYLGKHHLSITYVHICIF